MADTVLVTGGSGFVGQWCVARLLQAGHGVRATLRDLGKSTAVRSQIAAEAPLAAERDGPLQFTAADLMDDAGWAQAAEGCRYVLHVASPFPDRMPADEQDLIRPAREGTLRVLRAAVAAGVERVVATSSVAAIAYGHPARRYVDGPPFTEADWTDPTAADANAYIRSKTIAERAARDFMAAEGGATSFATVNPCGIFGPVLAKDYATSLVIVERLLKGALPGCPRIGFEVVDVRDAADLHLLAMTAPGAAGGRYIAATDFFWFQEIARMLKEGLPEDQARRVPTRGLPDLLLRAVALVDPQVRGVLNEIGRRRKTDASAAKALGWAPRPAREAILASAKSLIAVGAV